MKISHTEWAKLQHLAVPCNAHHMAFGHCMNCGYRPPAYITPQPVKVQNVRRHLP